MAMQKQKQKQKAEKSYEERSQEIRLELRRAIGKYGFVYIPELCELLKKEGKTNSEIQEKVTADWSDIWEASSIYEYLPSWVHDQAQVAKIKKGWETRNANKLKASKTVFDEQAKIEIQEPKLPQPEEQEWDENLPSKFREIGQKGKTVLGQLGAINGGMQELFKALTESEHLPYDNEDLIVDYIKKTRDFRKNLILELDENDRKRLHNRLNAVEAVVQDTLDLLEKELKK